MTVSLLVAALLLGGLAFFEPCTIATHTLFAERAHRAGQRARAAALTTLWLTRSALFAGVLAMLVALLPAPGLEAGQVAGVLLAMAALYIVSRFAYLPLPHLELARLLPGGGRLRFAARLGLTLPACTIPLFLVVAGLAVHVGSPALAGLAGVLFATLFTLPVAFAASRGLDRDGRELLARAALVSPWLTALLLAGAALYLVLPGLQLDAESLRAGLRQAGPAAVGLGFLAGFVFSFNPVSFASIPVVLAYVTRAPDERKAFLTGAAFVAGMILTHAVLGVVAALGGEWVKDAMGRQWGLLLGPLLILLGLLWPGWLRLRLPWLSVRGRQAGGMWGAFLLGIPFSVAVCPFCTPALLVTLTASAAVGSVPFGFALLLAFAAGRSIPVILGAWSMGWLESLRVVSRHQKALEVLAGLTLIITGLYLLNEYFFIIGY